MSRNNVTRADDLFIGRAQYNRAYGAKQGIPWSPLVYHDFGAPILFDIDSLIDGATGTELPNTETVTYTFPAGNVSPQDGVNQSGVLATPRKLHYGSNTLAGRIHSKCCQWFLNYYVATGTRELREDD